MRLLPMKKETIDLGHGRIEVHLDGNFVYLNVFGEYTDDDAIAMTQYLENLFTSMDGPIIRVWDGTNIPENGFKLTTESTERFAEWSYKVKQKWPDNVTYMIADAPVKYGISRMYAIRASMNNSDVIVVHSIDELPENIKERIFQA
jgi:hypothetical protein